MAYIPGTVLVSTKQEVFVDGLRNDCPEGTRKGMTIDINLSPHRRIP